MRTTRSIAGLPLMCRRAGRGRPVAVGFAMLALSFASVLASAVAPAHANHYDHLLPPAGTCGSAETGDMSKSYYEWTVAGMCLIDHARARVGRGRLIWPYALQGSSYNKAADIAVCQPDPAARDTNGVKLVHTACGRMMDYWVRYFGYGNGCSSWKWAENVYIGSGTASFARAAGPLQAEQRLAVALVGVQPPRHGGVLSYSGPGTYRGMPNTRVWVYHMGYCR
ncbi:MAG TPA: hypothetical protein VNT54_09315 [Solirubrobacteraceae bacterium]|nr:hypothetical protein [Solirubrobacteraceae bacterium]